MVLWWGGGVVVMSMANRLYRESSCSECRPLGFSIMNQTVSDRGEELFEGQEYEVTHGRCVNKLQTPRQMVQPSTYFVRGS